MKKRVKWKTHECIWDCGVYSVENGLWYCIWLKIQESFPSICCSTYILHSCSYAQIHCSINETERNEWMGKGKIEKTCMSMGKEWAFLSTWYCTVLFCCSVHLFRSMHKVYGSVHWESCSVKFFVGAEYISYVVSILQNQLNQFSIERFLCTLRNCIA